MSEETSNLAISLVKRLVGQIQFKKTANQPTTDDMIMEMNLTENSITNKFIENDIHDHKATEKLLNVCYKIEEFLNYLNNDEHFNYILHSSPQNLQKRIDENADELRNRLAEIQDSLTKIKKLKNQKKIIKRENLSSRKLLNTMKDNEIQELVSIIFEYDKDLYDKWNKSKWKSDTLNDLMNDIQIKQLSLESLKKLIDLHLEKCKNSYSGDIKNDEKDIFPVLRTLKSETTRSSNNLNKYQRLSWAQRRFKAENRGNYAAAKLETDESSSVSLTTSIDDAIVTEESNYNSFDSETSAQTSDNNSES